MIQSTDLLHSRAGGRGVCVWGGGVKRWSSLLTCCTVGRGGGVCVCVGGGGLSDEPVYWLVAQSGGGEGCVCVWGGVKRWTSLLTCCTVPTAAGSAELGSGHSLAAPPGGQSRRLPDTRQHPHLQALPATVRRALPAEDLTLQHVTHNTSPVQCTPQDCTLQQVTHNTSPVQCTPEDCTLQHVTHNTSPIQFTLQ